MTTFRIDTATGDEIACGMTEHDAMRRARELADRGREPLYVSEDVAGSEPVEVVPVTTTQNEPRYAVVTEGYAVIAESESSADAFRLAEEAAAQSGDPFGVIDRGPRGALRGRFGGEPVWIGE